MKLVILFGLSALGCSAGESPASPSTSDHPEASWPAGTVLAINEVPIIATEVDELCEDIADLNAAWTQSHQRRLALTNVFLPRAAAHSRYADAWQAARAACSSEYERIRGGAAPTLEIQSYQGNHSGIGLDLWSACRKRATGEWSEPIEVVGRWVLLRLDESDAARRELSVSALVYRYVDGPEDEDPAPALEAAWAASSTTYVDPSWAEYIPKQWQFKQRRSQ